MAKSLHDMTLYCFSSGKFLKNRNPLEIVHAQIRGGADVIQLREKEMPRRERVEFGLHLRALTRKEGVLFIVNDDVDIAVILDADGVHLGQEDIPIQYARPLMGGKIIGVSTHSLEQAREAVEKGADYIGVGPIFETTTKKDRAALVHVDLLSRVKGVCPIPYVAIGGIGKDNIASVVGAGCRRAAIISDILLAEDIEVRCRVLKQTLLGG